MQLWADVLLAMFMEKNIRKDALVVQSKIKILLNEKDLIEFTKESDPDLFKSTCGGMGLTGFILEAEIECKKIKSSNIKYQKIINETLRKFFHALKNINLIITL